MSSLETSDTEAAAVATAPRVTLAELEGKIVAKHFLLGSDFVPGEELSEKESSLNVLTICVCVTAYGFNVVGKSAPASPENFDADLGKKLAYEDCVRQLWQLKGYALRERLSQA